MYRTVRLFLIGLGLWLAATGMAHARNIAQGDTILPANVDYNGYRLYIRNVALVKQKDDAYLLRFEAINTGKRPISFGPGFPAHFLQTVFDESLASGGMLPLATGLRQKVCTSALSFAVGDWQRELEVWVTPDQVAERPTFKTDDFERIKATVRPSRVREDSTDFVLADELDLSACSDLTVTDFKVLIQAKGYATVQFNLVNTGTAALPYAVLPQGLGIDFYLGGSKRITGSSKKIGAINISDRVMGRKESALQPQGKVLIVERLKVSDATRYTGVVTAQVDAGQTLRECDETNNESSLLLFD